MTNQTKTYTITLSIAGTAEQAQLAHEALRERLDGDGALSQLPITLGEVSATPITALTLLREARTTMLDGYGDSGDWARQVDHLLEGSLERLASSVATLNAAADAIATVPVLGSQDELLDTIQDLHACLYNWVEIAEDEDKREEDDEALAAAKRHLLRAGRMTADMATAAMANAVAPRGPEHLVVVRAELAFAMPTDAHLDEVYTAANCMLIPLQRENGGKEGLIDYAFRGAAVSVTPVETYDRDSGFVSPFVTPRRLTKQEVSAATVHLDIGDDQPLDEYDQIVAKSVMDKIFGPEVSDTRTVRTPSSLVDTRPDISYDYEDFSMDQAELEQKYGAAGHPEYTLQYWRSLLAGDPEMEGKYNGYWDWVMQQIKKDDDEIPGAPPANLTPVGCGDLLTAEEFEADCLTFSPEDGSGYWATVDGFDRHSNVRTTSRPDWATHVAWFNK